MNRMARLVLAAVALVATWTLSIEAQQAQHGAAPEGGTGAHRGTPEGWTFTWPKGDPARGREVFQKLECYRCHAVKGESFPTPAQADTIGPELSAMGPMHPPEYFAESIINPSAVIEPGKGYAAPDGSSKMPSFNDSVTVQEVIDLVAYLSSLKPPAGASGQHGSIGAAHHTK